MLTDSCRSLTAAIAGLCVALACAQSLAAPACQVVIESTIGSVSLNRENPLETIYLRTNSTATLYAVVRDIYGNYVGPCVDPVWATRDTTVAYVSQILDSGRAVVGGGSQPVGTTQLVVSCPTCADSDSALVDVFRAGMMSRPQSRVHTPATQPSESIDMHGRRVEASRDRTTPGVRFSVQSGRAVRSVLID